MPRTANPIGNLHQLVTGWFEAEWPFLTEDTPPTTEDMEQGAQVKIMLILRFPTLAQLLTKSRDSGKSLRSPVHCTGSHLCSCAASSLKSVLAGEVPLLIPLLNLPSAQLSLHFIQTLKTETYEEKQLPQKMEN